MTVPQTMTAIAIARPGGPEVLVAREVPVPVPAQGEVLICVAYAGVNGPDIAQRKGLYDPPEGASALPGLEVSGTIAALGDDVTGFAPGDRVMALTNGGGYAHFVGVPHGQVLGVPETLALDDAAALPETWFTVTQILVMRAGLERGMRVLVHGGAGGIGGAAIEICRALGAEAIAVVSSPEKAAYALSLGAAATIDRSTEDIAAAVAELTGGEGVDRVLDIAGASTLAANIAASRRGGHIIAVSTLSGARAEIDLRLLMARDLTLSGSTLRPQSAATKARIARVLADQLGPAIADPARPRFRVRRFALEAASEAHRAFEAPGHMGKIVLSA